MKGLYKDILNEVSEEHKTNHLRERNSRVLIIDGLNTFIRSWTTNPTMNEDGDHTGGVIGSLKSIGYQIREFNPTRCIVTFDGKNGSQSRKKIHEGYKAGREKNRFRVNRQYQGMMDEEQERLSMKQQFVWLNDILDYLPVQTMIYDGIEADDTIAYLTKHNESDLGNEVVIVSTDKDFLQLVSDKVKVFSPTKKKMYNRQVVFDEFGIWPENLLLYRTLDGDKSDNIPGIRGCGIKTLLKRFPELSEDRTITHEDLFQMCEEKQGKIKLYDDILKAKDQLLMNKRLMELDEPHIPTNQKLNILDRFNESDIEFKKLDFLRVGQKYKVLQNWRDINDWLHSTFHNIITK
jgi:DNA polymerase-1|tara:strand:- start:3337 stop:4383 length:1047 start_codon:yes stop_codon:yes gene_type:complete